MNEPNPQNSYLAQLEEDMRQMKTKMRKLEERESPIFEPDIYKWIIITIKDYRKRREVGGYFGMSDLPYVENDAINVREGIKKLGALDKDILQITDNDCNFNRLVELFNDLNE